MGDAPEPVWRVGESVPWSVAWSGEQAAPQGPGKCAALNL
jgi:hypothetical protein